MTEDTCLVKDRIFELVESGAQSVGFAFKGNTSHEHLEDLDSWNPMSYDFQSETFNSYKEPSITDFVNAFPGNSNQTSESCTKSSLKTDQSDVRLFVGRIPQQMTQEGLQNLFHQVGKISSCKLISQHNRDTKIGFVDYKTVHEAEAAIQKFDGFDLGQGYRLKVALASSKQKPAFVDVEEKMSDGESYRVQDDADNDAALRRNESLQNVVSGCNITKSSLVSTGRPCSFCGKSGLKWCSVCKTPYCSRDCQRNDWPKHKRVCPQQPLAERKPTSPMDTPRTNMETDAPFAYPAGNQPTDEAAGVPIQPTEEHSAFTMDQPAGTATDKTKDPENMEPGDVFDVQNAELFAQMMGFELRPVDEDSRDSDSSDGSTNKHMCQEAIPEVSVLQTKEQVTQESNTEKPAYKVNIEHGIGLQSVRPSAVNIAGKKNSMPHRPTCAKGHKPFFVKKLSMESVPSEDFFEVVVTEVENPSCFWVQLCTSEALERQNELKNLLQVTYCDSLYENFVPSSGEVCVAQFSLDHCWYRAKIDIVNNTGTLKVTYIDFGNHEDIAVEKVRRITEDLFQFPRQALKLSLSGISSTSLSGQWSSESTTFLKSKVLSHKCRVQVCGQDNEILFVKLSDPTEINSEKTINGSLIKAGFAETRSQQPPSLCTPVQGKAGFNSDEKQANSLNGNQDPDNACEQPSSDPDQQKSTCDSKIPVSGSPHKEQKNPLRNLTQPQIRRGHFGVIINAIVNPWEFYAMKTDKQLLDQLDSLMQDLNQHITGKFFTPQTSAPLLAPGDVCAARFSLDNVWYRALILEQVSGGFRVRYMDFGNSEVVQGSDICPLPIQFQSFPPLSLTCSLAGVRKPRGQNWCPEAVQHFKSLVANRPFLCKIIYTHGTANIVELLDPCQDRVQSVAKSLISAGLAEEFIPNDSKKHQSDVKRGLSSSLNQPEDGGTAVSPHNQLPVYPNHNKRETSQSHDHCSFFKGDEIESAVFQSAIQAAALPLDVRFDITVTEVASPGLFYCQLGTDESLQNGAKLTKDMNSHYNAVSYPPFVPHKDDVCAVYFADSGDWCRAYIKRVCTDGSVFVHYVDYGNTEMVPTASLRPLLQQFSFGALPFLALRCSLANITAHDASGWSDEAMTFIKNQLVLFSRYNVQLVGRRRGKLFLDVAAKETGESVSRLLVSQGLAKVMVKPGLPRRQLERHSATLLESIVYQPAIQTAVFPQDKSLFDVIVTEVEKSGLIFVQIADPDTVKNLKKLSDELNAFYHSSQPSSYQPKPNQFCAAHFSKTGDWCRAFIKEISLEHLVEVHYVDYGNTEKLSVSSIKPLMDNFTTFPFFALPCSLANVTQPESGWSDEAIELIREAAPLFQRQSAKVVGKRRGMLYVDFIVSKDPLQYLSQLLLNKGFAQRVVRGSRQGGETPRELQKKFPQPQEESLPVYNTPSSRPLGDLESSVFKPAFQSVAVLDSFDAMISDVESPDVFFIQMLTQEKVQSLKQLSEDLNAHYNSTSYPPFQPQPNLMCVGQFSGSSDWCRAFVDSVTPDGSVHVHYFDYGNSEVLPLSQVRPLAKDFQKFPPMALKCSLSGIQPAHSSGWSDGTARESMLSLVPLFSRVKVKVIRKEDGLLVIDVTSPESPSQETLSQFLVSQGIAKWHDLPNPPREHVQPMEKGRYLRKPADLSMQTPSGASCSNSNRVYASTIPLVDVSQNMAFDVFISEVQRPDKMYFQVLSQENATGLAALSEMLNTHCTTVDNSPYKPVLGELCCARFTEDGLWYRCVAEQELSESMMVVKFVDYGNQDSVAVGSIRRITSEFTHLPLQARQCYLVGIKPTTHSFWCHDALNFVKGRLTNQRFIAEIENTAGKEVGLKLFEVGPDLQRHGNSINHDMIQLNFASSEEHSFYPRLKMSVPKEDQFDVVVREIKHPGEVWVQVMHAESNNSLSLLMEQINNYCMSAPVPALVPNPGQEFCALSSTTNTWCRARALECPKAGQLVVQYVDFGNSELITPKKIRPMKDEFFELPAQALKLSLANVRPANQLWSHEAVGWLKHILNLKLTAKVVHRLPQHLVVLLENWAAPEGPCNINEELVRLKFAVKC